MLQVAGHLAHAGAIGSRLFAANAKNAHIFGAQMLVRTKRNFAQVGEISSFHQQATDAKHFEAFGHGSGDARTFDDHVCAAAVSEIPDQLETIGLAGIGRVDNMIGAESLGELQAIVGKIDGDEGARAEHTRFHQEAHAERTDTEDHDGVIEAKGFIGESGHLFGAVEADGNGKDFREHGDLRRKLIRNFDKETSGNDVHILRPSAEEMRRIFGAEQIAVIESVLAAAIGKIVAAVVAVAAGDVGADNDAIADFERDAFEVSVVAVAADGRDGADVFVALDQRKFEFARTVLRGETLVSVLIGAANAGQLHFDEDAAGLGIRQRIFAELVASGFDEGCGQN